MSDNYEELLKKQLFAQRVTAVSTTATAVAAHGAATSLDKIRRDAKDAAQAQGQYQRKMQAIEEAKLSVIEQQALAEERERVYQRRVLFLKESDNDTKLDTYCEMVSERLLDFYDDPNDIDMPEECRENSALTKEIKLLKTAQPEHDKKQLPERIIKLQYESQKLKEEIIGIEELRSRGLLFGVLVKVIWMISNRKLFNLEKELSTCKKKQTSLEAEIKPVVNEVDKINNCAQIEAKEKQAKVLVEKVEQWRSIAFGSMVKHYFDQGLGIKSGGFTQRLKVALNAAQKPYPTSCRVNVEKLTPNQITSAYQVFTELVAKRMCKRDIMPGSSAVEIETTILEILRAGPVV